MRFKIIASILFFLSCTYNDNSIARNKVYYYSVSSPSDAYDLVFFLSKNLNNKRVAITNLSGQKWPFYEELAPDLDLPIDSLMPPHSFVHLLKLKEENRIEIDEYFLDIKVMMLADTLPNYELDIYKMDSEGLVLSAKSGVHYIDNINSSGSELLFDTFLKHIIRYSFK